MENIDRSLFILPPDRISFNEIKAFLEEGLEETSRLEYTQVQSRVDFHGVLQSICAMANTDGGIILVGVSEDKSRPNKPGEVVWMERKSVDSLKNTCRSSIQPAFVPEIIPVQKPDDATKIILLVRIDPERCPRPVLERQDGIRVRIDNSNQFADLYRLRQLFAEKPYDYRAGSSSLSFPPSSFLTLDKPFDLLIRCCLIGSGLASSGFNTSIKEHIKDFLSNSESPIEKFLRKYTVEPVWEYSTPVGSRILTLISRNPFQPKHNPGMANGSIDINARLYISQPDIQRAGALIFDVWINNTQSQPAKAPWYPLQLTTFYEILMTELSIITDPGLNQQLAEMMSLWPSQLQTYIHAQSQSVPWLDVTKLNCVKSLRPGWSAQAQVDFLESERIMGLQRIARGWINELFADHGCINYESLVQSL